MIEKVITTIHSSVVVDEVLGVSANTILRHIAYVEFTLVLMMGKSNVLHMEIVSVLGIEVFVTRDCGVSIIAMQV